MPTVRLIPIDETVRGLVEDAPGRFPDALGASLGEHAASVRDVIARTLALQARDPRAAEWGGFLAVDDARRLVVGACGYAHGPERDGDVEIAYVTFPEFQGRGYATAMAVELRDRALRSDVVLAVVAHTLPEPNASTRILEKIGMRRHGEAHDPDAGTVWRWSIGRGESGAS